MADGYSEDQAKEYPSAIRGVRYRVIAIVPCTTMAKAAYAGEGGQVVVGERIQAWAHVEMCKKDGTTAEELLPMVQGARALEIVDSPTFVGIWGDVEDIPHLRQKARELSEGEPER